jgi:hypothetical protein
VDTVRDPETGQEIRERRRGERRRDARRDEDRRKRISTLEAGLWAFCGGLVVLYLFFIAIGGVNPNKARAATIVVLVLAIAWLAHAWSRLVAGGHVNRPDRERRGF